MPGRTQPSPRVSPRPAGPGTITNPAVAARVRQLAAHAEHRRAIAEFQARHLADHQARVNALLLEAISALANLLGARPPTPARPARSPSSPHPATPERPD